jgi:hypothetical protein
LIDPPQEAGIFLGWRAGPDGPSPCLVVSVVDEPNGGAALRAVSWLVDDGGGVRAGRYVEGRLVSPDGAVVPVPLARPDDWHSLGVQVRKERVAIFVDEKLTWEFEVPRLKRRRQAAPLGIRGELGLFCRQATAAYRNVTLTALPPEEGGP